jgi:hypothetical protein
MVWRGVIIEESLDDKSLLDLVRIVKSKKTTLEEESERGFLTFLYIELGDEKKDEFVKKAVSSIKDNFYLHICKGEKMIVIFKDKMFEFSSDELDEINKARDYGLSIGIIREQMSFEELIKDPYG